MITIILSYPEIICEVFEKLLNQNSREAQQNFEISFENDAGIF